MVQLRGVWQVPQWASGLDEVGPAIPILALVAVRREPRIAKLNRLPAPQQPALVEGKSQHRFRRRARVDRTLRHQEGADRQDILARHPGVAVIGHRRVEPRPVRPQARLHGADEVVLAPVADPVRAIGRDVGCDDRAERRRHADSRRRRAWTGSAVWHPPQSAARARYSPRRTKASLRARSCAGGSAGCSTPCPTVRRRRSRASPKARPGSG